MVERVDDIDQLWVHFSAHPSPEVRDKLIVHYAPLVKYVAGRVGVGLPRNVEQADLASFGTFGLIDAIEKFDPERGFAFETYAIARIKGAILDELRSIDWVPRSVRSKARDLEQAIATLESKNLRAPTDAEVAEVLGVTGDQLRATLSQISLAGVAALDEMLVSGGPGESFTLGDSIADPEEGPMGIFEAKEMRETLAESIRRMPERERLVLTLYYFEGLTLAGDFVRLPIPSALMERAAASGFLAANHILARYGVRSEPLHSIPPRGLLAWLPFGRGS